MHVLGLLGIILQATKLLNRCVSVPQSERQSKRGEHTETEETKQEGLWTNGNGACSRPLSVTQRKELLTCGRESFKMCKGGTHTLHASAARRSVRFRELQRGLHVSFSFFFGCLF